MGWNENHRRNRAIEAVLDRARRTDRHALSAAEHPEITEVFGSEDALLAALHYKWKLCWTAQLDLQMSESDEVGSAELRHRASLACRQAHPVLWQVLAANPHAEDGAGLGEFGPMLLSLADLTAVPAEPAEVRTRRSCPVLRAVRASCRSGVSSGSALSGAESANG